METQTQQLWASIMRDINKGQLIAEHTGASLVLVLVQMFALCDVLLIHAPVLV
jgi:hypothetical protein